MINDILDFSKIEAGKLELESVDFELREVLDQALALLGERAGEKGIELAVEVLPEAPAFVRGRSDAPVPDRHQPGLQRRQVHRRR